MDAKERYAKLAYETYREELSQGMVWSNWDDLPPSVRWAWEKVVLAVANRWESEKEEKG